jgi:hypothetical protein
MEIKNTADLREALIEQMKALKEKRIDPKEAHQFTSAVREIIKLTPPGFGLHEMGANPLKSREKFQRPLTPIRLIGNE